MNKINETWTSRYWHPAVTSDAVIFGYDGTDLNILLIQRKNEPFKDCWAIPGGFLDQSDDNSEECAKRELKEETCTDCLTLHEVGAFTEKDRDPRERVISIAYYALVNKNDCSIQAADDAKNAEWIKVSELSQIGLAFDHRKIIDAALGKLRNQVLSEPVCISLLDKEFTLSQLHNIYSAILDPKHENVDLYKIDFFKRQIPCLGSDAEKNGSDKSIFEHIKPVMRKEGEDLYYFSQNDYDARNNG